MVTLFHAIARKVEKIILGFPLNKDIQNKSCVWQCYSKLPILYDFILGKVSAE